MDDSAVDKIGKTESGSRFLGGGTLGVLLEMPIRNPGGVRYIIQEASLGLEV